MYYSSLFQFTLHAQLKGNKPDFRGSMGGEAAPAMYAHFLQRLRDAYEPDKVKDGRFGAMMRVQLENDGPVTITLDSPAICDKAAADADAL